MIMPGDCPSRGSRAPALPVAHPSCQLPNVRSAKSSLCIKPAQMRSSSRARATHASWTLPHSSVQVMPTVGRIAQAGSRARGAGSEAVRQLWHYSPGGECLGSPAPVAVSHLPGGILPGQDARARGGRVKWMIDIMTYIVTLQSYSTHS